MANEITKTVGFRASKNGSDENSNTSKQFTMTGNLIEKITQVCTTTAAALDLGNLTTTTAKTVMVKASSANTDSVQIGTQVSGTDYWLWEVVASDGVCFNPIDSSSLRVKSTSGSQTIYTSAAQD